MLVDNLYRIILFSLIQDSQENKLDEIDECSASAGNGEGVLPLR
jgi:hypothetical protein